MRTEDNIRHPFWASARHLALPMLLCWFATPIAFSGAPYGRSLAVALGLLAMAILLTAVYFWAVVLNYRHVMRVLGRGQCLECGYELWPTIKAGRRECPECGSPISPRMAQRVIRLRTLSDDTQID